MAKEIWKTLGDDIQSAATPLQACVGHATGCEAAIHALKEINTYDDTKAILLVDATNVFNAIKHQAAPHKIQVNCPAISSV